MPTLTQKKKRKNLRRWEKLKKKIHLTSNVLSTHVACAHLETEDKFIFFIPENMNFFQNTL